MENTGNYYLINHLVLITGLTDRTLRSYIASGVLQGEKINGLWHFTPEQVGQFLDDPAVRPSIRAKHNAHVYDFLLDVKKTESKMCVILDLPEIDRKSVAEFFCYRISNGNYHDINFSFNALDNTPRVQLSGAVSQVLQLLDEYMDHYHIDTTE